MNRSKLLLLTIMFPILLYPCDCEWGGSFMESLTHADMIIQCEVVDYDLYKSKSQGIFPTIMSVEVKNIIFIRDDSFAIDDFRTKKKVLRIIGNVQSDCRPSIQSFEIGSKLILKVNKAKQNYYQIDFSVSNCAANYLVVEDGIVKGNISEKNQNTESDIRYQEMKIESFIKAVKKLLNSTSPRGKS